MTRLVAFTAAWSAGILLFEAALFHPVWFLLTLPLTLTVHFGWRHRRVGRLIAWALMGLLLGAARFWLAAMPLDANHIAQYNGAPQVELAGVVIGEPDQRQHLTNLRVRAESILWADGSRTDVHGDLLVKAPATTEAFYGDRITVRGALETPPAFEGFSYRDYLARQGIHTLMRSESLNVEASHQASRAWEAILRFKAHALSRLLKILPEPQASLLAGILLGVESGIPKALNEAFSATGTSHIVAISGFNLTIVAGVFIALAHGTVGRRLEVPLALAGVWLYTLLVGAAAAVVRAAVMGSVAVIARHGERSVHGPTSLAFAAFAMSLHNPWVLWDLGFQLSLAATAGLIFFTDPLTSGFKGLLRRFMSEDSANQVTGWLSEALIVTLAAQITTTPIIVANFHRLSLVTLLTNFLILPVQTFVMLFGAVALLGALLWLPLGQILGWLAWAFLTYTIEVVRWTATFPWASVSVGRLALPLVWSYYAALALGWTWATMAYDERRRWRRWISKRPAWQSAAGLALVVLIVVGLYTVPDGRLHVTFLDVGRGNAVFLRTPTGKQVLIGGAPDASRLLSQMGRRLPFWDRRLDGVILPSLDAAHLTGLLPVLERYQVDQIVYGAGGPLSERWEALLAERDAASVRSVQRGDTWALEEGVWLRVLWPPAGEEGPLVLSLAHGGTTFLLAGDATTMVEAALVKQDGDALSSNALHVPRHGAKTAATAPFVQVISPELAVISAGDESGARGRPAEQTLARLLDATVYRTDQHGAVELSSDGQTLTVRTARQGE